MAHDGMLIEGLIGPGQQFVGRQLDGEDLFMIDENGNTAACVQLFTGPQSRAQTNGAAWTMAPERTGRAKWRLVARSAGSKDPLACCSRGWTRSYSIRIPRDRRFRLRARLGRDVWRLTDERGAEIARYRATGDGAEPWIETAGGVTVPSAFDVLIVVGLQAALFEGGYPQAVPDPAFIPMG